MWNPKTIVSFDLMCFSILVWKKRVHSRATWQWSLIIEHWTIELHCNQICHKIRNCIFLITGQCKLTFSHTRFSNRNWKIIEGRFERRVRGRYCTRNKSKLLKSSRLWGHKTSSNDTSSQTSKHPPQSTILNAWSSNTTFIKIINILI